MACAGPPPSHPPPAPPYPHNRKEKRGLDTDWLVLTFEAGAKETEVAKVLGDLEIYFGRIDLARSLSVIPMPMV